MSYRDEYTELWNKVSDNWCTYTRCRKDTDCRKCLIRSKDIAIRLLSNLYIDKPQLHKWTYKPTKAELIYLLVNYPCVTTEYIKELRKYKRRKKNAAANRDT